jgi:hypothetical protein
MTDPRFNTEARLVAAVALAAGPVTALLYESDVLSLGPSATLWPIGFVAIAALAGMGTGIVIMSRLSRWVGGGVVVANGLVLAFYGFLLLFFGLGGSR